MKHTVKLDAMKSISISPMIDHVKVELNTFGMVAMTQTLTPDQAQALGDALMLVSEEVTDPERVPS